MFSYESFLCTLFALLLKAIERGDQSTVEQWLQNEDTKVNDCRGGNASRHPFAVANGTALHWAVYYGQLDIAQLLLQNGAGTLGVL